MEETLKDVRELFSDCLQEAYIDEDNKILKNVTIAGSATRGRKSKNGYEYSDKSFDTLTHLAEGSKAYIDHPSHSESRDREA